MALSKGGAEKHFGCTYFETRIVSRWAAFEGKPTGVVKENGRLPAYEKIDPKSTGNLLSPISFRSDF